MSLYVYVSEKCEKDAENHSLIEKIEELKNKIEYNQEILNFKPLQFSGFLKKPFGKTYRLFMNEYEIEEDTVIIFLTILPKSHNDEKKWTYDNEFRNIKCEEIFNEAEIYNYLKERKENKPLDPPPKPTPEEEAWLTEVFSYEEDEEDIIVLETHEWIEETAKESFQSAMTPLCVLLEKIDTKKEKKINCEWSDDNKVGFLYRYFDFLRCILLIKPTEILLSDNEIDKSIEQDEHLFRIAFIEDKNEGMEALLKSAYRSYPHYITIDKEAWRAVQKGKEANLALSPEESNILKSVKKPISDSPLFPLFINGRAGSGKSTLLHYLMKDYIEFANNQNKKIYPCYLTQSQNLLYTAKNNISQLLKSHYESLINERDGKGKSYDDIMKNSFHVFHELILSTLPEELKSSRFTPENYITHRSFRKKWHEKFSRQPKKFRENFNPDICWHVIRTYIKGMAESEGDFFNKNDYKVIPRDQKTVTEQTFNKIYDNIWRDWYFKICEEEGYWDDQDLVMAAIEHGNLPASYGTVICDESQDFTLIEIEFIYYLSLFSRKSVYPHQMRQIPFVFAGDPLQTLNPTGFRWESLRNLFYINIIQRINRNQKTKLEFNYQDLNCNYRSVNPIVRFCNILLLMRSHLFAMQSITPQLPWRDHPSTGIRVSFLDIKHDSTEELLRKIDTVKIVNCESDAEQEFVTNDKYLSKIITLDEERVPMNVLSTGTSKGLEYDKVILYRFGDMAMKNDDLMKFIVSNEEYDPDKHLPFEYFFNSIYVAASRAKKFLYVVDNLDTYKYFWKFASDPDFLKEIAKNLFEKKPEKWDEKNLYNLPDNTGVDLEDSDSNADELAKSFEDHGHRERSPSHMRRARQVYRNINREKDAIRCHAYALKFEEKYEDAGNKFLEINNWNEAIDCFWLGRNFKYIVKFGNENPDILDTFKYRASRFFMESDTDSNKILSFLKDVVDYFSHDDKRKVILSESTSNRVVNEAAARAEKLKSEELSPENWSFIYNQMDSLVRYGFKLKNDKLAEIAFRAGDYLTAIRLWDNENKIGGNYIVAKINTEKFPKNLRWLSQKDMKKEIIDEWHNNQKPKDLEQPEIKLIFDTLLTKPDYLNDAFDIMKKRPKEVGIENIIITLLKHYKPDEIDIETAIAIQIYLLFEQRRIIDAISFIEDKKIQAFISPEIINNNIKDWNDFKQHIIETLVNAIAQSEELPNETPNVQKQVSDFLRDIFCKDPRSKILNWNLYRSYVSYDIAGAAIERAGRIIDALSFYEWLRKNGSDTEQEFAKERLIKCRLRRAKSLEDEGRPEESKRVIRELEENIHDWGTKKPELLNEYPEIEHSKPNINDIFKKYNDAQPKPSTATTTSSFVDITNTADDNTLYENKTEPGNQVEPFSISYKFFFGKGSKFKITATEDEITIDNIEEFSYAKYYYKTHTMKGGGQFELKESGEWYSRSWNISFMILEDRSTSELMFYRGDLQIFVTLPFRI